MSDTATTKSYQVALLLFQGVDMLDVTGPVEVLSHVSHSQSPALSSQTFEIKTVASGASVVAASSLQVEVDFLLEEIRPRITEFDMLVVPGAALPILQPLLESGAPELDLIRAFAAIQAPAERPRILFSVCTGAILLGAAGVLSGLTVTTHHHALDTLRDICAGVNHTRGDSPPRIVRRRFVDGGCVAGTKVQVITSGGISSGLDATFYIVCRLTTAETASFISRVMEYGWKEPEDGAWPPRFQVALD
ncbi:DJ-1 domain InhA-type [Penicillium macrosclerotiorum]|uniref:DJ-1 domain InhA-type n=1 Tax=Penicillium macrosclerotiorum TaxID=303699 RepID=UPI00254962CE|nr:DJ-1 domain InhA-type [Penicillium macrosclerotiorum]KAJ5698085.1 DJ-1 domain InhA-type [Penicillium macrosclerotiorum]